MVDAVSGHRTWVGVVSLVVGPALMSLGDLVHASESEDAARQVALIADGATQWYAAHALLFLGMVLFVPGLLALTGIARERRPRGGYASQVLMLMSVGALCAVFVFEMLIGRFISDGAEPGTAVDLLEAFRSPAVFLVVLPGLVAFFAGSGLLVASLAASPGPLRWSALLFGLGALLILVQIVSAQVWLSKVGNVVILLATTSFAVSMQRARAR